MTTLSFLQKSMLTCAIAAACSTASASSDFILVVPMSPSNEGITFFLKDVEIPEPQVGHPYAFRLSSLVHADGVRYYKPNEVIWSITAGSLPQGLSIVNGQIIGTPTALGTSTVTLRATYRHLKDSESYSLTTLRISVGLSAATLAEAYVGDAFTQSLVGMLSVAGDPKFDGSGVTWHIIANNLPAGLRFNGTSGAIEGTPTEPKVGSITVRAEYRNEHGEQTYEVVSTKVVVNVAEASLPPAVVGDAYVGYNLMNAVTVSGYPKYDGTGVQWRVVEGSLPAGLTLNSDGRISGTPTSTASAPFKVAAQYRGVDGTQTYSVVTTAISVSLPDYTFSRWTQGVGVGIDFSGQPSVTGDPYYTSTKWSFSATGLPPGVSINSNGWIGGTPTAMGIYTPTITATYAGRSVSKTYSIPVGGVVYGKVSEDSYLTLTAPAGMLLRNVTFASYGTPGGSGPNYYYSGCNSGSSMSLAISAYVGKQSGSIRAHNSNFGDPCGKTTKSFAAVVEVW